MENCSKILQFPWEGKEWEGEGGQTGERGGGGEEVGEEGHDGGEVEEHELQKVDDEEEDILGDPSLGRDWAEDCEELEGGREREGRISLRSFSNTFYIPFL